MSLLPRSIPLPGLRSVLVTAAILGATIAYGGPDLLARWETRSRLAAVPKTVVRRADVEQAVLSPGLVASSRNTEIRCQLERLDSAATGGMSAGGASTILSLVPSGTMVEEGQILCELDGSDYQELLRRQQIVVEQARAEHVQATLTRDVARLALESYRDGEREQVLTQFKGQIALARSDLERHSDRVAWTLRMLDKGYVSAAQLATDKQTTLRLEENLRALELSMENYLRFSAPMELMALQKQLNGTEATLSYQATRLRREEERLAHYQKLADRCVIRAPHRGFVIHANRPGRDPQVYEGASVRERMLLFTLPDLSQMEVQVMLHETVVNRIRPGMRARVQVDALPGRTLEGRVESINPMPLSDQNSRTANQIAYFIAHVQIESMPAGLRPGMTAAATILCEEKVQALTLPVIAVSVEGGRNVCYVLRDDGFERRPVTVTPADHELFEVKEGLSEGEIVALDPEFVRPDLDG
ncbi:MAG: efflux RND transporter periplasmic adaptor subunit [Isosphaeraceae bacterium]